MSGTALPPNLLLLAKLVAATFLITGQWTQLSDHFLPFIGFLDDLGSPSVFHHVLEAVFLGAAITLFFNTGVRVSCLVLGSTIAISIASSHLYFENNRTFSACLFLLVGLYQPGGRVALVRYQVVLLYVAAALNKLFDVDWRTGRFIAHWAPLSEHSHVYSTVSDAVGHAFLATATSWMVIGIELLLALGFCLKRFVPAAIWIGIAYHASLMFLTGRTFGMFVFAAPSSYLAFLCWSRPVGIVALPDADRRSRFLKLLDRDDSFEWRQTSGSLAVTSAGTEQLRWKAVWTILLNLPATYVFFALLLTVGRVRIIGMALLLIFLTPLLVARKERFMSLREPADCDLPARLLEPR